MEILVVKIGSNAIAKDGRFDMIKAKNLAYSLYKIRKEDDIRCVLIVSGAVVLGAQKLRLDVEKVRSLKGEERLKKKQICASVGQRILLDKYTEAFSGYMETAQVLVTQNELNSLQHRTTIAAHLLDCLQSKTPYIVPLINYNDAVDVVEVDKDNDGTGADIATLLKASRYIILTGVDGILDKKNRVLRKAPAHDPLLIKLCKGTSKTGVGGMETKIEAAKLASKHGIKTIIASIDQPITDIVKEKAVFTLLY